MLDIIKKITSQFDPTEFFQWCAKEPAAALLTGSIFAIFFLCVWISPCREEESTENVDQKKITKPTQKRNLSGRLHNACLFVSDPSGTPWKLKDKERLLNCLREAEAWLTKQAEPWGVYLEFTPFFCLGLNDDVKQKLPKNRHQSQLINELVSKANDVLNINYYKAAREQEAVRVLLFVNKRGRSFACPSNDAAVIYNDSGYMLDTVIAHELLHLYGASDLYQVDRFTREQAKLASRLYPKDIMNTHDNLKKLRINPFTAFKIGWHQSNMTDLLKRLES